MAKSLMVDERNEPCAQTFQVVKFNKTFSFTFKFSANYSKSNNLFNIIFAAADQKLHYSKPFLQQYKIHVYFTLPPKTPQT